MVLRIEIYTKKQKKVSIKLQFKNKRFIVGNEKKHSKSTNKKVRNERSFSYKDFTKVNFFLVKK